ncbi:hypothetical protein [Mycobacterium sp. 48b]|uniref:hypothetical protein n=1 Tax=Mycobacterium sp. 48b TaxID=3400426 RepID=UPI003AAD52F2
MTLDDENRIVELTKQDQSAALIAEIIGTTKRTVQRVRSRRHATVSQRRYPHQLTAEQISTAEQLLDDGASYAEVGRTIGIDPQSVQLRWPNRGWTPQMRGQHSAFIRNMRKRGIA